MDATLKLRYSGELIDNGEMDAYDVGSSMMAMSDLLAIVANDGVGHDRSVNLRTTIRQIVPGSIEADFGLLLTELMPLYLSISPILPRNFADILKQVFDVYRALNGTPPASTKIDGDNATINTRNGTVVNCQKAVFNVVLNHRTGKALDRLIGSPARRGVRTDMTMPVDDHEEPVFRGAPDDGETFSEIRMPDEIIHENIETVTLEVIAPAFRNDLQWRFNDGSQSFTATIRDARFLRQVATRERFGKGDTLVVRLKKIQTRTGTGGLSMEREIVEILEHRQRGADTQAELFGR